MLYPKIFVFILTLTFLLPCAKLLAQEEPKLDLAFIKHDRDERSYYFHLPNNTKPKEKTPLLIALHSELNRNKGIGYAQETGYHYLADIENFVVVFPNSLGFHWNDGRDYKSPMGRAHTTVDDLGFIQRIIKHFVKEYNVNPQKIYIEGNSSGGMMSYYFSCHYAARLTAMAATNANMPQKIKRDCLPRFPLPTLIINGDNDPIMPWKGGLVRIGTKTYGEVMSTFETFDFWAKNAKCIGTIEKNIMPQKEENSSTAIKKYTYNNCNRGTDITLYEIINGGHIRPGELNLGNVSYLGQRNRDIETSIEVWNFFKQF